MSNELFVYGTLVPDGRYWDVVSGFVVSHRPARVRGLLYDTGRGYPAATFDIDAANAPEITGFVLTLDPAEAALAHLDRFEGEEYERIHVRAADGTLVLTYQWRGVIAGLTPIANGAWPRAARAPGGVAGARTDRRTTSG